MNQLAIEQGVPPSFNGNHFFYLLAIFGLMTMTLLAANWLWRVLWCMREDPHPLRSPITAARITIALLMIASLMRGTPDVVLLLQWPEISPSARQAISETDRFLDGLAIIPFLLAWLIEYLAGNVIQFQLKRMPMPPTEVWPTAKNLAGPAKIAAGSFAIAFAVVFLQ